MNIRKRSLLILVCASLFWSCSGEIPAPADTSTPFSSGIAAAAKLEREYGLYEDAETQSYVRTLTQRLFQGLETSAEPQNIRLLSTATPLAYSPSADSLLISTGLIQSLETEADLAFVIAHELAHSYLGHHQSKQPRKDLELEADRMAARMLVRAGYDPKGALNAILVTHTAIGYFSDTEQFGSGHPQPSERMAAILHALPPNSPQYFGTQDRRRFHVVQSRLAQAALK